VRVCWWSHLDSNQGPN